MASRFRTYGVELHGIAADYAETILRHQPVLSWHEAAADEPWAIPDFDGRGGCPHRS